MCVYSNTFDSFRDKHTPNWNPNSYEYQQWLAKRGHGLQQAQQPYDTSKVTITREEYQEYQRLIKAAKELDKAQGNVDCEKPEVAVWEALIEDVLRKKGLIS